MADEKVISFRAQDTGLSATMQKLRTSQKQSSDELLQDAVKYGRSIKEVNQYLEEQIRLSQRRSQIIRQSETESVKSGLRSDLAEAKTSGQRESAVTGARNALGDVEGNFKEQQSQTHLLRELIDTIKVSAKEELKEDRNNVEKTVSKLTEKEISQMSPAEQIKVREQQGLIGGDSEGKESNIGNIVKMVIGSALVVGLLGKMSNIATSAIMDSPERLPDTIMKQLPEWAVGATGEFMSKHTEEKEALEIAHHAYKSQGGSGFARNLAGAGFKFAEVYGIMAQLSKQRGTSTGAGEYGEDVLSLKRGFGLDDSGLMTSEKLARYGGGGSMQSTLGLVNRMKSGGGFAGGDYSRLEELLGIQNNLMQQQVDISGNIDEVQTRNVMMSMRGIGGKFMDDPKYISQISQAIANPNSDYAQARNMSVLAGLNPGGSYLDMMKMQEKGVFQPGLMTGLFENIQKKTGGGDMAEIMLGNSLGGKFSKADVSTLWNSYQKDKRIFEGVSSEEDIDKMLGRGEVVGRGKKYTSKIEADTAAIADAFSKSALTGLNKGMDLLGERFGEKAATALEKALSRETIWLALTEAVKKNETKH